MIKLRLRPITMIYAVVAASALAILSIGGIAFVKFNGVTKPFLVTLPNTLDAFEKASSLNDLSRLILFSDEVLTQAARNYAFTQDAKWKRKYLTADPEHDRYIHDAIVAGGKEDERLFKSVDAADQVLDSIEKQAIAFVDSGCCAKAITLLESPGYWGQKDILRGGLEQYSRERGYGLKEVLKISNRSLKESLQSSRTTMMSGGIGLLFVLVFALIAVCIIGVLGVRFLRMDEALKESEKSFRSMFELTSDGVALISPKTKCFIAANPAMCSLFGYTENEFLKLTAEDITPPEVKEIMHNSGKILANEGNVPDHEGVNVRKDGKKINTIISCRPMSWKGERVFYVTFKDVTFLKDIQHRLENKNREILEFTDSITHDLKKPLAVMKTISSLMKNESFGKLNDDGKEAVGMGAEAVSYMQEMLEDLLAIAQLEAGVSNLSIEEFDLHDLALETVARLKYPIEEKKVTVTIDGELGIVKADKKNITKVYMNLLGNAVNYIGEGPDRKIEAGMTTAAGKKVYFVRDNGIGIPEETQKTLFQKFKRGANVSGISGTGLGLSIVKGIIEAHGGKIWVESRLGEGSVFYFTLAA